MLLRDSTKVWILEYKEIEDHGETEKIWKYKPLSEKEPCAFLNLQQDVNELDRKSTGEVDYSIYNARTERDYNINKGNGVSFVDISLFTEYTKGLKPDYIVKDNPKIGNTILYRMEKLQ